MQSNPAWPTAILGADAERLQDREVRAMNVTAGRTLAETIRSTLGPRGMDKMLVGDDGKVVVTNDGASILDRMDIDHPAAEALVAVARSQQSGVGDGTTTAVVLAGELLAEASELLDQGLHPTTIRDGYRRAVERATTELDEGTVTVDPADTDALLDVARTAVTGKWSEDESRRLLSLVVRAAQAAEHEGIVERRRLTRLPIQGGAVGDAELIEGLAIDLETSSTSLASLESALPRRIEHAGIALVDDQLTIESADAVPYVTVESADQLAAFAGYEDEVARGLARGLAEAGADVVFCQKEIDDEIRGLLAREGIISVERTRQDEMHKLERATGAGLVMRVDELTPAHVGRAGVVERRSLADTDLVVVRDTNDEQLSLVLRGGTDHVIAETKRLVEDCLDDVVLAIEEGAVVPGGGVAETALAATLRDAADGIEGREQLAIEAFADALEVVPRTLAETAGLDPVDALVDLRTRHHEAPWTIGIDVLAGELAPVVDRGVLEPLAVKQQAIRGAAEAAALLVGIDDAIAVSGDAAAEHDHEHDHDHGHAGPIEATDGYPWAVGH